MLLEGPGKRQGAQVAWQQFPARTATRGGEKGDKEMADKTIEQLVKQYEVEHAYNEEVCIELGKMLTELPVSDYGRFHWYVEDEDMPVWGVEVCWHTRNPKVFQAVNLFPHSCDDDCDLHCDQRWDEAPITAHFLVRALSHALIRRTRELEAETAEMRKAIDAFGRKKIGFADLKAL